MELDEIFKRVNELTGKFPNLSREEMIELRKLGRDLSAECDNAIWEMNKYGK